MNKMQRTVKYPAGTDSAIVDLLSSLRADVHDELSALSSGGITPIVAGNYQISGTYKETVRITGTITDNEEFVVSNEVRKYLIINDWSCSSNKYVHIRTQNGNGVYMAPGDVWSVYCDGIDIIPLNLVSSTRTISLPSITWNMASAQSQIPLSSVSPINDKLSEISGNSFIPKNRGLYQIMAFIVPGAALTYIAPFIFVDGINIFTRRNFSPTANVLLRGDINTTIMLDKNQVVTLYLNTNAAASGMICQLFNIIQVR